MGEARRRKRTDPTYGKFRRDFTNVPLLEKRIQELKKQFVSRLGDTDIENWIQEQINQYSDTDRPLIAEFWLSSYVTFTMEAYMKLQPVSPENAALTLLSVKFLEDALSPWIKENAELCQILEEFWETARSQSPHLLLAEAIAP
jgi:hypothetical protein